ncbi:MAG: L-threonylcarbamoyladenylate synthase [Kiritimatiellia bacterium]|nr:L-threonylcarbamoyladenylate synthase [Kiritimatiellia bacterium]
MPKTVAMSTEEEIVRAARILREGGVVAFPTETVYGLGAHAFDESAVARVFELKRRPRFDPLIVHLADPEDLPRVAEALPAAARALARRFWPGPLTLVLRKKAEVPDLVTSGLPTVAVRIPDHPVALRFIREAGVPVAAPSANPFGRTSPTKADHVRRYFPEGVDCILEGGDCSVGVESTVLAFDECGTPRWLRPGGLSLEEIESLVGPVRIGRKERSGALSSPGLLDRHYAPRTPMKLDPPPEEHPRQGRWGWIGPGAPDSPGNYAVIESLGDPRDLRQAAARLFAALHRMDEAGLDGIEARSVPDSGIGRAVNDRLRKAAASGVVLKAERT